MTYLLLAIILISIIFITSLFSFPFLPLVQSVSMGLAMVTFFLIIRSRLKPSLTFFHKIMKDVIKNDLTLDDTDIKIINSFSSFTLLNPKMLLKYTNLILKNQNTMLKVTCSDRDYIYKNRKLQNTIISMNHSIIATENTELLLDKILKTAIKSISGSDAGSIMVPDNNGVAKYATAIGMDIAILQKTNLKFKDTFVFKRNEGKIIKPVIVRDKHSFNIKYHTKKNNQLIKDSGANIYPCTLSAPISVDNSIYGVLNIDSKSTDAFDLDDLRMMEYFTSEIAIVIRNSRLINKAMHLSKFDSLTNVNNRHFFEEIAKLAFGEAARYKGKLHIVLFDLDNFKSVNDIYGHESGDKVLISFTKTISSLIRGSDVFARFGGDEFIALFRNSNTNDIEKKITSIKKELLDSPLKFNNTVHQIQFSYGISRFPEDGTSLEKLLRTADTRMYENKKQNKNGYVK